jgi:V/A-type H+/Na+-transporting ATPase subunit K
MLLNRVLLAVLAAVALSVFVVPTEMDTAYAQEQDNSLREPYKFIAAGMAFGLAALGAGFGLAYVGSAGLAALSENPKIFSSVLVLVGMVESIAIYGIVMMFIILGQ